ncbi:MAG: HD-GYP domain-containing protein [Eubacteriales bacterium]|nr:HD-GYP domain-containing protein [Eubacteriales bacterium]
MRYVPLSCVREGMTLADDLYDDEGHFLLVGGTCLTKTNLESIDRLLYSGIYIEDKLSEGIIHENAVNSRIRERTLREVRDIFVQTEAGNVDIEETVRAARQQVDSIVEEISGNKDILINMMDLQAFDDYTYNHSVNVAILSISLGVALGISKPELCKLGFAALLHDIGKVFVPKDILNKPDKLTENEFEEMKTHSKLGWDHIKKGLGISEDVLVGILQHHEKYGGGGYPDNLEGESISLFGRIIAAADVYDALTSQRPYRKAMLPSDAVEYVMASIVTQFDPMIVSTLVRKIAPYPVGTCVKMSNGMTAIVKENNKEVCLRPKVRVYMENGEDVEPYELDLAGFENLNIIITEIV